MLNYHNCPQDQDINCTMLTAYKAFFRSAIFYSNKAQLNSCLLAIKLADHFRQIYQLLAPVTS